MDMPPIDRERMTELLYALSSGVTVTKALEKCKVSFEEYCGWRFGSNAFDLAVCKAKRVSADVFVDRLIDAVESVAEVDDKDKQNLWAIKLKLETYRWLAERLNPDSYGVRSKVETKNLNYNASGPTPRVLVMDKGSNGTGDGNA